jgi:ABC-type ATPase involved in cell division
VIRLESGTYPVWDDFSLELTSDLTFSSVALYYLHGANGSGKSSFIERLLIPSLRNQRDIFLLYFEQQMHFQIQAVKAYASIMPPRKEIHKRGYG